MRPAPGEGERYVRAVLGHVPAAFPERRARIAADLRSHLAESVEAGESEAGVVRRMGPPEQTAATFLEGAPLPLASLAERAGAYVFDSCLFLAPALALLALAAMRDPELLAGVNQPGTPAPWEVGVVVAGAVAFSIFYFPFFEARWGQTPGKRLFGIAVVRGSGTAARLRDALLRRLPSLFKFTLLDALFAAFTARRQRAFDIVAGTLVVRAARLVPAARAWVAAGVLAAAAATAAVALASAIPDDVAAAAAS